ncbi:hypothetical protein JA13_141 [Dickeya phage vB_DsoM_JA13]|uniref:Uncharacterized protein n=1 Tax=Dickeya phage vB_DsoM_JA13 TaxID=2283030 RepID=A0A384ZWD5_9CAUD|nr:hypothetical protein JA13_141 [Dickeya phage vB_DsoM_JA13]
MANNIQTIVSNKAESWSNAIHIKRYPSGKLKFLVVGGTFENSSDQIEVTADQFGMYNFTVTATPPTKQYEAKHVTVYYDYAGQWTLLQEASRNLLQTLSKTVTPKALMSGFDALYKSDSVDPEFGEAVIAFGAAQNSMAAFDALVPKKLSSVTLNESAFDYKLPVWFVADKATQKIHLFNSPSSADGLIRYKTISQEFAEALAFYSPATHRRTIAIFSSNGVVSRYNVRMEAQPNINLGYRVVRVVLLKAAGAFDPLFAVFDSEGRIHKLDSSFTELSVKSDDYYVNCHESLDAYITRSGKLVGTDVWQTPDAASFFYAFAPGTDDVYAINFADNSLSRYVIKTGVKFNAGTQDGNHLRYPTTFTNPASSVLLEAGSDTTGRKSFVERTLPITDVSSRNWSYLNLMSNGETTPLYGFVARPTLTLTHTYLPTFGATLPTYNVPLGKKVTFNFTATLDDADDSLPIVLPAGIVWTATVNNTPVKTVRNGEQVTVVAEHAYLTAQPFPFSVGRSNGLVEVVPDPLPDPFTFDTIYDVPDYSWQQTVEKQITGVNQRVEFSVLIDGTEQNDRVEVFVNGVKTPAPVFLYNGDKFYLRVKHGYNITLIKVIAGEYETDWGIYTVSEIQFDPVPNRAYAQAGKEYRTVVLTNDGITALALTIDSDDGEFIQGGKEVTLEIGQSTQLLFTPPEPNKKYQIKFGSSRYKYTWDIWTHETWLDAQPAPIYSNGMVVAASDPLKFDEIPPNFLTDISVPAGILFEVDGTDIEAPIDSRAMYKNSFELKDVSCDSILKLESYPAHMQPKILKLGNAEISWLHDFAGTVVYSAQFDSVPDAVDLAELKYAFESRGQDYSTQAASGNDRIPSIFEFAFAIDYAGQEATFNEEYAAALLYRSTQMNLVREEWHLFAAQLMDMPAYGYATESSYGTKDGFTYGDSVYVDSVPGEFSNSFSDLDERVLIVDGVITPRVSKWNEVNIGDAFDVADIAREWNAVSDRIDTTPQIVEPYEPVHQIPAAPVYYVEGTNKGIFPAEPYYIQLTTPAKNETHVMWIQATLVPNYDAFEAAETMAYNYNKVDAAESDWYLPANPSSAHDMDWRNTVDEVHRIDAVNPRPIVYLQPTAEYKPPLPHWFELNPSYEMSPDSHFIFAPLTYKYLADPRQAKSALSYAIGTNIENKVPGNIYNLDTAVERKVDSAAYSHETDHWFKVAPDVYKPKASDAELVSVQVIVAGEYAPRVIENAAYPVERMKVTMFVPKTEYGEQDPLKKGYFATELDALQNAVNVWHKTPDEVFGIQQPDGTWTWAIKIPCGEYCGEFGCDTRGYLAGG